MTTMKERISNVIAWAGFSGLAVMALTLIVLVWDLSRDKPELIAEVRCENADVGYENLFVENYTPSECVEAAWYGGSLFKWEYKDTVYGYVSSGVLGRFLYFADDNIDGYTHGVGREVAETTVPWALPLWLISAVLNYTLFGSARLLPWKRAVISEETQ